jgi:5-methylcytosine-specific restriction protein A
MSPTIRVDEEVYTWLQKQARPFEDTPNSALRRVAGLDSPTKDSKIMATADAEQINQEVAQKTTLPTNQVQSMKSILVSSREYSGRQLNTRWKVGARHALYFREGTWYNNLERFPGALFDPNGYIIFKTEEEYRQCPYLSIGLKTNVRNGISAIPGYVRKTQA